MNKRLPFDGKSTVHLATAGYDAREALRDHSVHNRRPVSASIATTSFGTADRVHDAVHHQGRRFHLGMVLLEDRSRVEFLNILPVNLRRGRRSDDWRNRQNTSTSCLALDRP